MKISFHGAARTVTGSKHLIHLNNGKKILLDCGLFQGLREKTREYNSDLGFDAKEVDMVFLSHAHIDHSGLLPKLVKDGFVGKIYCTKATASLVRILLADSAYIQEADVKYVNKSRVKKGLNYIEPIYKISDAERVFPMLHEIEYEKKVTIDEDVSVQFTDAGHILGSASVHLSLTENGKKTRITFSGDVGRYRDIILKSPATFDQADYIILESTYGNSLHKNYISADEELLRIIEETCIKNKGRVIIPAFSVGRTQEILYDLNMLELENRLPDIEYYVDSPLSNKATAIIRKHPECYNKKLSEILTRDEDPFGFKGLKFITEVQDSKALNSKKNPMVIISASGMATAGRVKHHIANAISDSRNTILLVGYCEPDSLGAKLMRGDERVRIFGEEYAVQAQVASIRSMSAHGDYDDLCQYLACQNPKMVKKLFLVHGEHDVQADFSKKLVKKGFLDVVIPDMHETVGLG
jgi:metallo-beta-lactamase family protein